MVLICVVSAGTDAQVLSLGGSLPVEVAEITMFRGFKGSIAEAALHENYLLALDEIPVHWSGEQRATGRPGQEPPRVDNYCAVGSEPRRDILAGTGDD
jgi:hypothetical protein